jgi:hypothetical protein
MLIRLPLSRNRRSEIVRACLWTVANNHAATYSEGAERLYSLTHPYTLPFISDCSAGVTDMFRWGGARDPNGLNYGGDPYTGTLIAHGKLIAAKSVRSADVGIIGPGTGWHAVLVTQGGSDPMVWSMGEQGDPHIYRSSVVVKAVAYVNHVEDAQVRWFRYSTAAA